MIDTKHIREYWVAAENFARNPNRPDALREFMIKHRSMEKRLNGEFAVNAADKLLKELTSPEGSKEALKAHIYQNRHNINRNGF